MRRAPETTLTAIAYPVAAHRFHHRRPFLEHLRTPFAAAGIDRGTRTNHVAADAEAALFTRHRAGQPGDAFLRRGVGRVENHAQPRFRTGVDDDAAALA